MPSNPPRPGKLVLLIGPSGVGKSVILLELRKRHPELHFPRSATTRAKRPGEGTNLYRFVDDATFDDLIKTDKFLEWAFVHGGTRYGTLIEEIIPAIEEGKIVIREVDIQGFDHIRENPLFAGPAAPYRLQSIFILPQSKEQLITHITKRAPIGEEELGRRLESMKRELEHSDLCDVQIKNEEGKLEETIRQVENTIFN